MSPKHCTQSLAHPHAERGYGNYSTPPCATEALCRAEQLPHRVWECAAGEGNIAKVLRDAGHIVYASDIVEYPNFQLHAVTDFLVTTKAPDDCRAIVTNPPFQLINEFIARGLGLVPRVTVLARIALLESEPARGCSTGGI